MFSGFQSISLLSPIKPTGTKNTKIRPSFLTINIYPGPNFSAQQKPTTQEVKYYDSGDYTPDVKLESGEGYYSYDSLYSAASPHYNEQDPLAGIGGVGELPPIPTYQESQLAYYPHGIKRLPHFHPPRYSKRLRSLMSRRSDPLRIRLSVETDPSTGNITSATVTYNPHGSGHSRRHSLVSIMRSIFHGAGTNGQYGSVSQNDHVDVETGIVSREVKEVSYIDRRVAILIALGTVFFAAAFGAWIMAMLMA